MAYQPYTQVDKSLWDKTVDFLPSIGRAFTGQRSENDPLNVARRAAAAGDYETLGSVYGNLNPRNSQELEEANQYRRILQGRDKSEADKAKTTVKSEIGEFVEDDRNWQKSMFDRNASLQTGLQRGQLEAQRYNTDVSAKTQMGIAGINSGTQLKLGGMNLEGVRDTNRTNLGIAGIQSSTQRYLGDQQYKLGLNTNQTNYNIAGLQVGAQKEATQSNERIQFGQQGLQRELGNKELDQRRREALLNYNSQNRRGIESLVNNAMQRSSFR